MSTEFDRRQQLEWQAQERALREEREPTGVQPADARIAEYRLIARALRQPFPDRLPAGFARELAARVGEVPLDTRLERWLMRVLIGALVVSGLAATLINGAGWWQAVVASVPETSTTTVHWMSAVAVCVGGSWLFERMRQVATQGGVVRA